MDTKKSLKESPARDNTREVIRVGEARGGPSTLGGTYTVIFRNDADATVTVGALGTFDFPSGYYGYVGSAFGPGGVRARTDRHRRQHIARKKWNIDHMKPLFRAVEVWWTNDPIRRECSWSAALASTPGFDCPAAGFGSHDCRVNRAGGFSLPDGRLCKAHLYRSLSPPDVLDFARRLGHLVPGHAPLLWQRLVRDERGGGILHPSEGAARSSDPGRPANRRAGPFRSRASTWSSPRPSTRSAAALR